MDMETLRAIAKMAEDKHVRIELLPLGFGITVRALTHGRGMVQVKQMLDYTDFEDAKTHSLKMFESVIDTAIAKLNVQ